MVAEHVKNGEYFLLLKLDLICNKVLSFGDHVSMNVFKNDLNFIEKLLTEAKKNKNSSNLDKSNEPEYDYAILVVNPQNMTLSDVRIQLSSYLGDQGWGRNTHKRYGVGVPPVGYPDGPEWTGPQWTDFKGVSKRGSYSSAQLNQ